MAKRLIGVSGRIRERRSSEGMRKGCGRSEALSGRPAANSHLRRDALGKRPPFHGRLVLHVLDLLLQCVLVHGGEYTGIHGYSRTPLVAIGNGMARAPIRGKINRAKSGARYRVLPVTRVRLSFIGVQKEEV